jgi:hypothetical protein
VADRVQGRRNIVQVTLDVAGSFLHGIAAELLRDRLGEDERHHGFGDDLLKVRQIQEGRWVVVWPKPWAAPRATVIYPGP